MEPVTPRYGLEQPLRITLGSLTLDADLTMPPGAHGIVMFAHGSGSSRHSPRNRYVAQQLQAGGLATLLLDLLTIEEERIDTQTAHLRFDIGLLAERLVGVTDWLTQGVDTAHLGLGYFGASTGAAAALVAAAARPDVCRAIVSRGGRPDLAGAALTRVTAPTLLIVGSLDQQVIGLNQQAMAQLRGEKHIEIVPGASHLFQERGKLEIVARLAFDWFSRFLTVADPAHPHPDQPPAEQP